MRCNVGEEPCETVKTYHLVGVPVTEKDLSLMQNAVQEITFPAWAEVCDQTNPGCSDTWKEKVGPIAGMK